MTKFDGDVELQWHYFEPNHGKGAVDGIGGMVKHAVLRHVLSKQQWHIQRLSDAAILFWAHKLCL